MLLPQLEGRAPRVLLLPINLLVSPPRFSYTESMENASSAKRTFGCLHILLALIVLLLIAILGSLWWMNRNVYAKEFTPVTLKPAEQVALDAKLQQLEAVVTAPTNTPEAYTETGTSRRVVLSEKELNALIARDPQAAKNVAIDLADNLVSIKIITPMDADLPLFGGKTFKFNMGIALSYSNQQPNVTIRGISLGGIPLPGAWWGDIKNKNLVEAFGTQGSFWDSFARGVEYLEVKDGSFILHLKE
jgi:hypothetical protein